MSLIPFAPFNTSTKPYGFFPLQRFNVSTTHAANGAEGISDIEHVAFGVQRIQILCLRPIKGFDRIGAPMTIEQFTRQTYLYPVLWYVFATIVSFVAALLFWQKGSSSAEGKVPGLPVSWKFTGAGAVFVVVMFLFWIINPLKPFSDYKKIVIVNSNQDVASPTGPVVLHKITPEDIAKDAAGFDDPANLQVELIPYDSVYVLQRKFTDNSLVTASPIPKGKYRLRLVSPKTAESKDFFEEVK